MYNTHHAMRAKRTACAIDCSRASARLLFYFLSLGQLASRKNGTGRLLFLLCISRLMERSLSSCFLVIFLVCWSKASIAYFCLARQHSGGEDGESRNKCKSRASVYSSGLTDCVVCFQTLCRSESIGQRVIMVDRLSGVTIRLKADFEFDAFIPLFSGLTSHMSSCDY
jgi:hypothetical protein